MFPLPILYRIESSPFAYYQYALYNPSRRKSFHISFSYFVFFSYIRIEKINFNSEFNRFIIIFYPLPQYALYNPPRLKSFHICYIWIQTATLKKKLFKKDFPNRKCNVIYYWKCSGFVPRKIADCCSSLFLITKITTPWNNLWFNVMKKFAAKKE